MTSSNNQPRQQQPPRPQQPRPPAASPPVAQIVPDQPRQPPAAPAAPGRETPAVPRRPGGRSANTELKIKLIKWGLWLVFVVFMWCALRNEAYIYADYLSGQTADKTVRGLMRELRK